MPHVLTKTVYYFDELNDKAKEQVRDWYMEGALSFEWWGDTFEDAKQCAAILGIEIDEKSEKRVNVSTHKEGVTTSPAIYFSGFSSQGDGACLEGQYGYAEDAPQAIRSHAPSDTELHRIADELEALQQKNDCRLRATVKHRGHYYHSRCTDIDVTRDGEAGTDATEETVEALSELLRDFMTWIYRQLETEHDHQLSDETVDESIRANEYEFTESGKRAC
jgi:hypothetical protein